MKEVQGTESVQIPSRKLTWKPKKGPMKTRVLVKGGYMGFHVSLGECKGCIGDILGTPSRRTTLWGTALNPNF